MKKTQAKFSARQLLFSCLLLLVFTGLTIALFTYKQDEKRFSHITSALFEKEMTSNTLNMHYTIAHPEAFGICQYEPKLPVYSAGNRLEGQSGTENLLSLLNSIKKERLSDKERYTYTLLKRSLTLSLAMSSCPYYNEPLSPSSGMQTQLPILLAEYTFRSKQDVLDYLALLEQTDDYFTSLLVFEQEKAEAGFLMPVSSLESVRKQCDTLITAEALETGSHFLQTSFAERLVTLSESVSVTKEEALSYISRNNRLLKTIVLPAYEALSDGLYVLENQADAGLPKGLAAYPEGAQYYQLLLISETGSYRTPEQVKELLAARLLQDYENIRLLAAQNPDCSNILASRSHTYMPGFNAGTMLTDLQQRMQADFPTLPSGDSLPSVTVKNVSEALEDYSAPAFYLTTPIDDTDNNVIYINRKNTPDGMELYTTLAHEGYPGHLYQNVYCNRFLANEQENKIRQLLWYGGYLEGWALYCEFLSFDYASTMMQEQGRDADAACVQLEKHNRSLQLCLYSLLDIMIHYENATPEQIALQLSSFGVTDIETAHAVYTYIAENPCNYLKYYLGYLEILNLKEQAASLWGNQYSDLAFHTFYLECGPSDFQSLKERLSDSNAAND
ncbi:MAG: DUF885 domain-containing protein [Roseburia sp.]|nr:DUF885 domain-containing protein [Roseburia sp.]